MHTDPRYRPQRSNPKKDFLSDMALCIAILVIGIVVGWRGYYLTHVYNVPQLPHCVEDEWISPETGECVHIDTIVDEALAERGTVEVPR